MPDVNDVVSIKTVVGGMDTIVEIMEKVWSVMVSNPLLLLFLSATLLSVGIKIFRKVKGAAKG